MSISAIRKEIKELKNSILYKHEPACRVFILGKDDSTSETEITDYRASHPRAQVIVLYRRNCGSGGSE